MTTATKTTLTRLAPGAYSITKEGHKGEIFQYDSGNWRGWWLVKWEDGSYSDPVQTLREAKAAAEAWQFD